MKDFFVTLFAFEPPLPASGTPDPNRCYAITDGVVVEIVEFNGLNIQIGDPIPMLPHPTNANVFYVPNPAGISLSSDHRLRVGFLKKNFSPQGLVTQRSIRYLYPSQLPYWDTGWGSNYNGNDLFDGDVKVTTSLAQPHPIYIPLREFTIISHHGASDYFPENTIDSYAKALDLGATGIEIDICPTKDWHVVCYHNITPASIISKGHDATMKYTLQSPKLSVNREGFYAADLCTWNGKAFSAPTTSPMNSVHDVDIPNLTFDQFRTWYHYQLDERGMYYPIPELLEFLTFARQNIDRLECVFVDTKDPLWNASEETTLYQRYGQAIGEIVQGFPELQEIIVICNPDPERLDALRTGVRMGGAMGCRFGYDRTGIRLSSPTSVAKAKSFDVVSVGNSSGFNPGSIEQVRTAIRDRDHTPGTSVRTTIYWTLNDASQFIDMFRIGVNAIITDKPYEMREALRKWNVVIG